MTETVTRIEHTPVQTSLDPASWGVLVDQAQVLVKTGFLPKAVDTPEKAIAIMLKARELGIGPMYALSNINVIEGKPTAGAELMLALIYRDHGDEAVRVPETTPTRCVVQYKRRRWKPYLTLTYTMEDARKAGVTERTNWKKYPAAMLRARAISAVARLAFPDSIGGLYTPDEMGAEDAPEGEGLLEGGSFEDAPATGDLIEIGPGESATRHDGGADVTEMTTEQAVETMDTAMTDDLRQAVKEGVNDLIHSKRVNSTQLWEMLAHQAGLDEGLPAWNYRALDASQLEAMYRFITDAKTQYGIL